MKLFLLPIPVPRRDARAKKLLRYYLTLRREYERRKRRRIFKLKHIFRQTKLSSNAQESLSSLSSLSSDSFSSNDDSDSESSTDGSWADILGSDWRGRGMSLGSITSFSSPSSISDLPELVSVGNGSDSSSSPGYGGDKESDFESDMLDISDDDDREKQSVGSLEDGASGRLDNPLGDRRCRLRKWVSQQIGEMYEHRYEMSQ